MTMKNIIKALLFTLLPLTAFAQNQGDDLGLGQGATAIVGRTNEARANTAGTSGKANYIGLTAKGDVYTVQIDNATGLSQSNIPLSTSVGLAGPPVGNVGWYPVTTDSAETGSTTTVINATTHVAKVGDVIHLVTGNADFAWASVEEVAANTITLSQALPVAPANGDTFWILRPRPLHTTDGTNGVVGLEVAISRLSQNNDNNFILKAEDGGHTSGDALVAIGGVNLRNFAAFNSTSLDYTPIGVGDKGVVAGMIMYDSSMGGGSSAVVLEDSAISTLQASVLVGTQLQDPLTIDSASGDLGYRKADLAGRTIVTMAPASERWSACSASSTDTSNEEIKALVASNKICATSLSCFNTAAVASSFTIKSNDTVIYAGGISNSTLTGVAYWEHSLPVPICTAVGEALNFDMATTATATTCCGAGFITVN